MEEFRNMFIFLILFSQAERVWYSRSNVSLPTLLRQEHWATEVEYVNQLTST